MKYAIITGSSRGLGAAIAKRMLEENVSVIGVSRSQNEELKDLSSKNGVDYHFYTCNLASSTEISSVFQEISELVFNKQTDQVYLINNAGIIEPIETAGLFDDQAMITNIQVNLTAPIQICNLFLKRAKESNIPLSIANVTSGAAERPVHGWSLYCSTKAGLNMFTQTTGLELDNQQSPFKVIGYSPGIMDTEMQSTIRSSSEEAFAELDKFKDFKEKGMLRSTTVVANALVKLVLEGQVENGKIYYVNDLL
ncbi:MAG: (S)-benzoin forming benzil reductase [Bacillota bacterium]